MLSFVEDIAVALLEFVGLEGAKFALGDIFAVLVVSGVAWVLLSAVLGNVILAIFSNRFGEDKVHDALKYVVVFLGIATFYGGFYLYSIGF